MAVPSFEWIGFERAGGGGWELSVAVGAGNTSAISAANGWKVIGDPSPHPQISLNGTMNVTAYYSTQLIQTATVVAGNYIGTNATGSAAVPNTGDAGITVGNSAVNTRIGTDGNGVSDLLERNVISGNAQEGIQHYSSVGTSIAGNYIGLDANGTNAIGNAFSGIYLTATAKSVRIGTNGDGSGDAAERNIVAANGHSGIAIDSPETGTFVAGNFIGTNAAGNALFGNGHAGVWASGTNGLVVGTNGNGIGDAIEGNLISGNGWDGVRFLNGSTNGVVAGNLIGTNAAGLTPIRNSLAGVAIYDNSVNIRVGTNADGVSDVAERNIISGNTNEGVWMRGVNTTGVVVAGNYVGVDITGSAALGNGRAGVDVNAGAKNTRIGTNGDGVRDVVERNIISANGNDGVLVRDAGTNGTAIAGNYIGTDVSGTIDLGNAFSGVSAQSGSTNSRIGTDGSNDLFNVNERNVISGNERWGVDITGASTSGNVLAGNYIGTNVSGTAAIGNGWWGVAVSAPNNVVGGSRANEMGNLVSGNSQGGITILNRVAVGNQVLGNHVGTTASGTSALRNGFSGLLVGDWGVPGEGPINTTVGGTDPNLRNVFSGNGNHGVWVTGTTGTLLQGNYIGVDASGNAKIANSISGVSIFASVNTTVNSNVVSGNALFGIQDVGGTGTVISGNFVGTNFDGTVNLGNSSTGVSVDSGSIGTIIGTNGDGTNDANERNIIAGNNGYGIRISDSSSTGNVIAGNFIGLKSNGSESMPNALDGILVDRASRARIGTNGDGLSDHLERNVVSGNTLTGIRIAGGVYEVSGLGRVDQLIAGTLTSRTSTSTLSQADLSDVTSPSNGNWTFNHPVPGGRGNDYAFVATGSLQVNVAGTYSFAMAGNEGGRLRINGATVITDDQLQGFSAAYTSVTLAAGTHTFEWTGFERTGVAGWELSVALGAGKTSAVTVANGWKVLGDPAPHSEISLSGLINVSAYYSTQLIDTATVVAGNYIGTNVGGSSALPNRGNAGILVGSSARNTRIGTNGDGVFDAAERNVVSGNAQEGIQIEGSASSTVIAGNYIGSDATGQLSLGNGSSGIYSGLLVWGNATDTRIGGTLPSQENVFAYNTASGVSIPDSAPATSSIISKNIFRQNALVGMDLGALNATPNDSGDTDSVRNAPVITSSRIEGAALILEGFARPGTTFDLYQTSSYANGFGQGERFLTTLSEGSSSDLDSAVGSYGPIVNGVTVGSDTTNRFRFEIPLSGLPAGIANDTNLAAIAVGPTSEFSAISQVGYRDVTPPVSAVTPLLLTASSLVIPIIVSGTDPAGSEGPGSGILEFDLYVAVDSGPYTRFATVPAASPSTNFTAESNHVYFFRSVARDHHGNEEINTGADAFTRVGDLDPPSTQVINATPGADGFFTLEAVGVDNGGGRLTSMQFFVSIDGGVPLFIGESNASEGSASIRFPGVADGASHTYGFYSRGVDVAGNVEAAPPTADVTSTVTFGTPGVLRGVGIDVQLGATQRSFIRYVDVLFNSAAGVSGLTDPNRIRVEKFALSATDVTAGTGSAISASVAQVGSAGRLRLDFGSQGIGGNRNTTAGDGFYRILVDANGDGDYSDEGESFEFYRLLGDANGDAVVDSLDTTVVDSFFGMVGANLDGDLNGDGVVNSSDRGFTLSRFRGRRLSDLMKGLLDD